MLLPALCSRHFLVLPRSMQALIKIAAAKIREERFSLGRPVIE